MKRIALLLSACLLLWACQPDEPQPAPAPRPVIPTPPADSLRYLALGDSYTIGTGVPAQDRWPTQLVRALNQSSYAFRAPVYIARNGWTTSDLLAGIEVQADTSTYDLVSLLIGVNNQYRSFPFRVYEEEFPELLDLALDYARGDTGRVFVLSIPDYGVTPFGQFGNPERIGRELDQYNATADSICTEYGISFFTITDLSRQAGSDPELIAPDGLHPSGKQYAAWVARIRPFIQQKLLE